jgi:hypothetical protein
LLGHHFTKTLEALDGVIRLFAKGCQGLFEVDFVVALRMVFTPLNFV